MKIKNINGLSAYDLQQEADKGARFVYYAFTVSLLVITLRLTSGVYLIKHDESSLSKATPFTVISALFGWWGIPFGPKYTIESIRINANGGKDVTEEVMATVAGHILFREAEAEKMSE